MICPHFHDCVFITRTSDPLQDFVTEQIRIGYLGYVKDSLRIDDTFGAA